MRFTEKQIIGILKQAPAGMKIVGLCRNRRLFFFSSRNKLL
jgi:hypothetical protein